jgi:hypothetical protein
MNCFSTLSAKREMLRHSPSPVHFAGERVPDRAGEGSLIQTQALEPMAKSPHPAFGHFLPPAVGEGAFARREISQ